MMPEYMVQQIADTGTVIPVGACIEASDFDTSAFLPRRARAYQTDGVQWSMPFNVSDPVLYYNRTMFEAAGLDPDDPPVSLEELRAASQAIVDSGRRGVRHRRSTPASTPAAGGSSSSGSPRLGELYADNDNGRLAPATRVLYDGPAGVALMTEVQSLIADGLAVTVGDNPSGQDALLKLADPAAPAAMTIATSAALGTVLNVLDGGLIPGVTSADVGVGPMPGPGEHAARRSSAGRRCTSSPRRATPRRRRRGTTSSSSSSAQSQSTWAAATGYVPGARGRPRARPAAVDVRHRSAVQGRLRPARSPAADDPTALGPVLGPLREVRTVTAGAVAAIFGGADVASTLAAAAQQSDALIADYNARN